MKNLFRFLFIFLAVGLVSCQSDNAVLPGIDDDTENIQDSVGLRAAYHYFDMQAYGYGREICYNLLTYSHTYDQFTADFDVEWYIGEDFNWLSTAFNSIENYPRMNESGYLYSIAQQGDDYYTYRYGGHTAEYSIKTIEKGKVRISLDKVPANSPNTMSHYKIPVRTKFTAKDGSTPVIYYDLIWDCKIWGGTDFTITRTVVRSW
ncbi:MAG: hypothetical protein E6772_08025 [Dysgonomonas sp.]|nr:hypothetical protein [Dysgonomonas sp.]